MFYFAFCISVAVEITEYFQKSTVKLVVAFQKNDISIYCAISFEFPAAAAKSLQSCPTLCDPIDGSPQGSPVPGILQARTLECAQAWKPSSQHAGEKRGVAGLLLGRTERAARAAELQLCAQAR